MTNPGQESESGVTMHRDAAPASCHVSVLTISDSRTLSTDKSGDLIVRHVVAAGHIVLSRHIVRDEPSEISKAVLAFLNTSELDVIILTGGTGITSRDRTPEAIRPLLEVEMPGFGELFRLLSYEEIGPAAMLSRAFAGRAGRVVIFALPGSTAAVRLAMEKLIIPELGHLVHHARD